MSNHDGGYLLNEVLLLLEREGVFRILGREKVRQVIRKIVKKAVYDYDCNNGEILDGIGTRLKICYSCLKEATNLSEGLCKKCDKT